MKKFFQCHSTKVPKQGEMMRRLSDLINPKGININSELVKMGNCGRCGKELKTFRIQMIGGPKKGEWTTISEECCCYLSKQALEAKKRTKIKYFTQLSTINDSLKQATLENYSPNNDSQIHAAKKAIEFIEDLARNKPSRIVYYGESGLGKSHLAVSIQRIVESNLQKTCLFLEVPTLKHMIKSSWSKDSDFTEVKLMRAIAEVDLLILDDFGAEGITPWTKELMFTILNSRLSKSLLITTNMELSDIYIEYGPKITDRLIQGMSKNDILKLEGKYSYRLKDFLDENW